ncbi:MAG TPA: MraY family glycosyltransferase, partial [Pirellulales bacterium]
MARAVALRWGIVDCPDGRRKLQKRPVPLLGGMAVFAGWWLGLAITAALGYPLRLPAAMPHAAVTLAALSLVGICDDAYNLRARWKLLAQILATLPIALSGCGLSQVACCGWTIDLGIWGPAATVLWLIVGINALNLIDGMDGMASLTGLCICLTAAALDMQSGGSHVGMFVLGLAGA